MSLRVIILPSYLVLVRAETMVWIRTEYPAYIFQANTPGFWNVVQVDNVHRARATEPGLRLSNALHSVLLEPTRIVTEGN